MGGAKIGSIGSIPVRATSSPAVETSTVEYVVSDPASLLAQTAGALSQIKGRVDCAQTSPLQSSYRLYCFDRPGKTSFINY